MTAFVTVYGWGFGKCMPMLLLIPVILFFDYTKTYKNKIVDTIIPVAGIALLVFLYIEGLFEVLKGYIVQVIQEAQKESEADPQFSTIQFIKNLIGK